MGALLLFKIAVPFFLVILTYRIINRKLQTSETGAFLIVVVLSEVMTVNFFFLVKVNKTKKVNKIYNFFYRIMEVGEILE